MTQPNRNFFEVTVIKAEQLTQLGWFGLDDRYYVKATVGNEIQKTKELSNHSPRWDQCFAFTPEDEKATLILEVYGVDIRSHERLGVISHALDMKHEAQSFRESLSSNDAARHQTKSVLEYTVVPKSGETREMASEAAGMDHTEKIPITPLLGYLEKFSDSMSVFAEIHPYAKAAWKILSVAYKLYQKQMEKDRKVYDLYREMSSMYKVLFDGGRLDSGRMPDITKNQCEVMLRVSQQTNECAYFIRDYCSRDLKDKVKALLSDRATESQIADYVERFKQLKQEFRDDVPIVTQIAVSRIMSEVQDINKCSP